MVARKETPELAGQPASLGAGKIALIVGCLVAVAGAGVVFSGGLPELRGSDPGGADSVAVSRPLADGQNITIITGSNSPVTLNIATPPEPEALPEPDEPDPGDPGPPPEALPAAPAVVGGVDDPLPDVMEMARANIKRDEGYSETPYNLHGYDHVCYGHQMLPDESRGPRSADECLEILNDDSMMAEEVAMEYAGGVWESLSPPRQSVLVEMAYLLGYSGLFGFENMRLAIQRGDWEAAADEIMRSLLPEQIAQSRLDDWRMRLVSPG